MPGQPKAGEMQLLYCGNNDKLSLTQTLLSYFTNFARNNFHLQIDTFRFLYLQKA